MQLVNLKWQCHFASIQSAQLHHYIMTFMNRSVIFEFSKQQHNFTNTNWKCVVRKRCISIVSTVFRMIKSLVGTDCASVVSLQFLSENVNYWKNATMQSLTNTQLYHVTQGFCFGCMAFETFFLHISIELSTKYMHTTHILSKSNFNCSIVHPLFRFFNICTFHFICLQLCGKMSIQLQCLNGF